MTLRDLASPVGRRPPARYRVEKAVADLEAQEGRTATARLAAAARYLEPAMIPLAATVWLYDLMLLVG